MLCVFFFHLVPVQSIIENRPALPLNTFLVFPFPVILFLTIFLLCLPSSTSPCSDKFGVIQIVNEAHHYAPLSCCLTFEFFAIIATIAVTVTAAKWSFISKFSKIRRQKNYLFGLFKSIRSVPSPVVLSHFLVHSFALFSCWFLLFCASTTEYEIRRRQREREKERKEKIHTHIKSYRKLAQRKRAREKNFSQELFNKL